MGYDCHFQLIDPAATQRMLAALVAGAPPPPSPFDARPDAQTLWAQAREIVLGADRSASSRAAGELVAQWNAASLAFVWVRNLGATYHPIRMEDALKGLPSHLFGSPDRFLFDALPITLRLSGRLEGNAQVGGYVANVEDAAHEIRALYDDLFEPMQRRLRPVLALFRAAERRRLAVLESSDLLPVTSEHAAMLHWPGLSRFGLEGEPLTAEEWRSFARANPPESDLRDAVDRIVECDVADAEKRAAVLALLIERSRASWTRGERARIAQWIAKCFSTADLALASRAMPSYGSAGSVDAASLDEGTLASLLATTTDPSVVSHWVEHFGPESKRTPSAALAQALLDAMCNTTPRFHGISPAYFARHLLRCGASNRPFAKLIETDAGFDYFYELALDLSDEATDGLRVPLLHAAKRALDAEQINARHASMLAQELASMMRATVDGDDERSLRERAAEVWCALYESEPSIDPSYSDGYVEDVEFALRVIERLLRAPQSVAQLRAVAASLQSIAGWEDGEGDWIAPFCERYREALFALIELGLARDERETLRAAQSLLGSAALKDPRWERALREAVSRDQGWLVEALAPYIKRTPANAALFASIELAEFAASTRPSCTGIVALLSHGTDVSLDAMRAAIDAHQRDTASRRSIAEIGIQLSSKLINAGWPRQAIAVLDAAIAAVPAESRATLLYNHACAWAKAGDAAAAARSLAASAAIDPSQLADAESDSDFEAIRREPAFAALFANRG